MAITGQELRSAKPNIWRNLSGPLLAASAVAFVEILLRVGFKIPNPPAILLLIVAFSAFYGGMASGMVSAAMAWLYFAYFFSIPGQPFHYAGENFARVAMWAVTTPAMALMIGFLKSRAMHVSNLTAINTTLKAQMIERQRAEDEVRLLQTMTVAVGEAEPLNLAYGRGEMFGDHFTVWAETDTGFGGGIADCYPNNTHGDPDVAWATGTGFCNEFDPLEGYHDALSEEASLTASAGGDFLYAIWGQFNVDENHEFVDGDAMFRRVWYLDSYISETDAWTLPGIDTAE